MLFVTVVYTLSPTGSTGYANEVTHLRWGPTTHVQFWFAMLGGSMAFMHYFFLLKAFEGAPSTVLLPLVQVASVSVLLGSSVVALTRMPLRCVRRVLVDANPRSFNLLHPGEASVRVYTDREDGRRSVGEWSQRLQHAVGALAACGDVGEKPPAQIRHAERLYTPMAPPL